MALYEELDAIDKKGLMKSNDNTVSYSTGFLTLDYANGSWVEVQGSNGDKVLKAQIGLQAGSIVSIIGGTGTGKTTFATQAGWNIVKDFEDGMLLLIDCEKSSNKQRITNIAKTSYDEPRIRCIKANSSIEDVLDIVNTICQVKESNKKKYMYEVKDNSYDGKPFFQYVPTVIIIDSLPAFNSNAYNTEDLGNNIDQMRASKDVSRFFTNILDKAWKYNIIFFPINHVRPNAQMDPYAVAPPGLIMINPKTETLPRGQVTQYFSSVYFRIRTNKSSAYTVADNGFNGFKTEFQLAKSRTNSIGTSFPITFNSQKGFDPIYSIYEFAHSIGLIQGRNPYLYIEGLEDYKFNRKMFVSKMISEPDFKNAILGALKPYYESLLGSKDIKSGEEVEFVNIDLDLDSIA